MGIWWTAEPSWSRPYSSVVEALLNFSLYVEFVWNTLGFVQISFWISYSVIFHTYDTSFIRLLEVKTNDSIFNELLVKCTI